MIKFVGKKPKSFKSPAEEVFWIRENLRIDGKTVSRSRFAEIIGVGPSTVDAWLSSARDRKGVERRHGQGARKSGRNINAMCLRLIRLEFGLEETFKQTRENV